MVYIIHVKISSLPPRVPGVLQLHAVDGAPEPLGPGAQGVLQDRQALGPRVLLADRCPTYQGK